MKKPFAVLSFFLLSGCVSTQGDVQDYLVTNADLPTKQKINHLKENVPSDGYDASGPCKTLLECAVYTKDICHRLCDLPPLHQFPTRIFRSE